ncbi:MAG: Deoxyribodipyrimidine photo-lyase [Alphaproteobacteria bacterium ADurb.Bin438]|nr:MAG: Deoxyribodipyrimidine photo-lyase [Alphaproteobacteria bacterium ADurb.Bin438]
MTKYLHIFRQDLRLNDNPALYHAINSGVVLPIFIFDEVMAKATGEASKVWLHHSLKSLNKSLNGNFSIFKGNALEIIKNLISKHDIKGVFWNRLYDEESIKRDTKIKEYLKTHDLECESFNGSLLFEPWDILKNDGTPYKVFTPFYKNGCLKILPRSPLSLNFKPCFAKDDKSLTIEDLELLPKINWHEQMLSHWKIGEDGANETFETFLNERLHNYKKGRDFMAMDTTSHLSPYLHFGEISPHVIWDTLQNLAFDENTEHFARELCWREFSYSLLYYNPNLQAENLNKKFDNFPWNSDENLLKAWQKGQTGYPIIDAGMRQLWQTGYMHNRVRMVVGSFLVKNLLLDWRLGEKWFYDCLFDADIANNSASWQWVAGCGADAAPYFRIFNPLSQSEKFDKDGEYIRKYVPEIAGLSNKFIHAPHLAPTNELKRAGIELGKDYPLPIVDLKTSRELALKSYYELSNS